MGGFGWNWGMGVGWIKRGAEREVCFFGSVVGVVGGMAGGGAGER